MNEKTLGTLEIVELSKVWADEAAEFTPWLSQPQNLALLSQTLDMELELEGIEVAVGPYKADIVANDTASNTKVIIENQLAKTNHDHLGKIITYASGLEAKVAIWIAKEFTEEHRQAIDYLNNNAAANMMRFYGLEIQAVRIGTSPPAPLFKIIAKPNEYSASVRDEDSHTETATLYLEFWTAFKDYCKKAGSSLNPRKPRPQHWFQMSMGDSRFSNSFTASTMYNRLGCEIYIRGADAKRLFKMLEKDKAAIESATGPLEWMELPDGQDCRIVVFRQNVDIRNKSNWEDAFKWLKNQGEVLQKAFAPRVKSLSREHEE